MAPPLPPKPTIGPLIRRTLFAAALGGVAGCSAPRIGAIRIGAREPPRIGPPPVEYDDAAVEEAPTPDAGDPTPDAAETAPDNTADAAPEGVEVKPIRIGPPPKGVAPPPEPDPREIRIGARKPDWIEERDKSKSTEKNNARGAIVDPGGEPLAHASLRIDLGDTTRIVATDGEGRFVLDGLLPGEHPVVIRARGFGPIEVTLGSARDVRIALG